MGYQFEIYNVTSVSNESLFSFFKRKRFLNAKFRDQRLSFVHLHMLTHICSLTPETNSFFYLNFDSFFQYIYYLFITSKNHPERFFNINKFY